MASASFEVSFFPNFIPFGALDRTPEPSKYKNFNFANPVYSLFYARYGGFCPRFQYESVGYTFGQATHNIMENYPYIAKRLMPLTYAEKVADDEKEVDWGAQELKTRFSQTKNLNIPKENYFKRKDEIEMKAKRMKDKDRLNGDISKGSGDNLKSAYWRPEEQFINLKKPGGRLPDDHIVSTTFKQETRYDYKGKCNGYTETYTVHRWFKDMPSFRKNSTRNDDMAYKNQTQKFNHKKLSSKSSLKNYGIGSSKAFNNSLCRLRQIQQEMSQSQIFQN